MIYEIAAWSWWPIISAANTLLCFGLMFWWLWDLEKKYSNICHLVVEEARAIQVIQEHLKKNVSLLQEKRSVGRPRNTQK